MADRALGCFVESLGILSGCVYVGKLWCICGVTSLFWDACLVNWARWWGLGGELWNFWWSRVFEASVCWAVVVFYLSIVVAVYRCSCWPVFY